MSTVSYLVDFHHLIADANLMFFSGMAVSASVDRYDYIIICGESADCELASAFDAEQEDRGFTAE